MNPRSRLCAACLPVLLAILSPPAWAGDGGKCKMTMVAKFPVVMEGPRASVQVSFNGKDRRIWLDSGAFFDFMPKAMAVELALPSEMPPPGLTVSGVGGSYTPTLVRVHDFGIAGATLHDVDFLVGGSDTGNAFLGANFLGIMDTEFDLAKGAVNLFKESGCNRIDMAYWSAGMAVGEARLFSGNSNLDRSIYVEVIVNDHSLRAILDTGAFTSVIGRHAAERAGIDLNSPQVVASAKMTGVGSKQRQSWIARTQTISIGGEIIRNSPIRVIDDRDDDQGHDMLLGVDFLMAHHVMVSQPQHKMFLTYNGGPIFSATTDNEIGHLTTRAENMGTSEKAPDPKTADEFAGRGSARLNRGDVIGSIADFTDAIGLAPGRADLLADRAGAYLRGRHPELAVKDIDAALAITPEDDRLLIKRAQIKLGKGDKAGALADTTAAAAAAPKGSLDVMSIVKLYERLGMADRGLALIDPVVELHRDDANYASLLNARSWNRGLANADLDRALKDANTAVRMAGPVPAILDTRALVRFRRKDYAAAIADETAALDKMPRLAAALFIRGLARFASGDAAGGNADIAAARAVQPKIDQFYAAYQLVVPADRMKAGESPAATAPPPETDGSNDKDE
jgi:predicted aspartyl protease/tetratricopeptide (TPR) repeat protein